jgi:hypothetical protein
VSLQRGLLRWSYISVTWMKKHKWQGGGGRERRVGVAPEEADELAGSVPPPDQGHGLQTLRSGPLIQWREGGGGGKH